jgi:glycosyltransferase involved in cell wall biosynthesis
VTFLGPVLPHRGGIAQHSTHSVRALRELGVDVEVVTWRSMYPRFLYPGIAVSVRESNVGWPLLSWWNPLSWLRAALLARKSDLVVVAWVTPFHSVPYRVIQTVANRPWVAIVHNASPHEPFPMSRALTVWGLRRAARFVVHSLAVADELVEMGLGQPVQVVAHPPNLDVAPMPLPPCPPYRFLCLGFVRPYKGVDLAIRALAKVRSEGWNANLTVAGEIWDEGAELRDLASQLGLTNHVLFETGYVPDGSIPALIAAHHVVVASYRSASQSGVVPLALAAGRPVVVTPVGGLPDMIEAGRSGVVAKSMSEADIAQAMVECVADMSRLSDGAAKVDLSWSYVARAIVGNEQEG